MADIQYTHSSKTRQFTFRDGLIANVLSGIEDMISIRRKAQIQLVTHNK